MEKEQPKTIEETLAYLAEDEREAIKGYENALQIAMSENMAEQLTMILAEEKAHLAYLEEAKSNPDAKYVDPSDEDPEAVAETIEADWME